MKKRCRARKRATVAFERTPLGQCLYDVCFSRMSAREAVRRYPDLTREFVLENTAKVPEVSTWKAMRFGEWIRLPDGTQMHICYSVRRKRKNLAEKFTWPATRKELYAAGYSRPTTIPARPCKRCGKRIEFWKTPAGSLMPLEENPDKKGELLCHFNTCPHAEEFRKPEQKARPIQKELWPEMFS